MRRVKDLSNVCNKILRNSFTHYCLSSTSSKYVNLSLMCIEFKNSSLRSSNLTPLLPTFLMLNRVSISLMCSMSDRSIVVRSWLSTFGSSRLGGFQPKRASPFNSASGRYPRSLYSFTLTSPCRLLSFYPFMFKSSGRCAYSGGSISNIL